jgi:hypothetical protein
MHPDATAHNYGKRMLLPLGPSPKHLKSLAMAVAIRSRSPMQLTILAVVQYAMMIAMIMRNTFDYVSLQ